MIYLCWLGLAAAVISILGLGVSGPGYRLGLWGFPTGISFVKYSAFLSLAAVVVCLLGLALWIAGFGPGGLIPALIGLVIGGFVAVWMLKWKHNLDSVPYIHDITTDTANPPLFEAILPLRAGAPNPAEYGGPALAKQQEDGYPDLVPGSLAISPEEAFPRASLRPDILPAPGASRRRPGWPDVTRWQPADLYVLPQRPESPRTSDTASGPSRHPGS